MDVVDDGDELRVIMDVMWFDKDDVVVNVFPGELQVKAPGFFKTVSLPENVDVGSARSRLNNGVLEVVFRRKARWKKT